MERRGLLHGRGIPSEVDPRRYEMSRRRVLKHIGAAAASVPFLGGLVDVLTERGAAAQEYRDSNHPFFAEPPGLQVHLRQPCDYQHVLHPDASTACRRRRVLGIPTPSVDRFGDLARHRHGHRDQRGHRRRLKGIGPP